MVKHVSSIVFLRKISPGDLCPLVPVLTEGIAISLGLAWMRDRVACHLLLKHVGPVASLPGFESWLHYLLAV